MKHVKLAAAAAVGVVLVAVAGTAVVQVLDRRTHAPQAVAATPGPAYTISGKIRLKVGEYTRRGQGCRSTKFAEDAQVVVADARGASLTYAQVGAGQMTEGSCDLPFTLNIPAGEGFYGVDVPGWGMAKYTEQQLADTVELTYS